MVAASPPANIDWLKESAIISSGGIGRGSGHIGVGDGHIGGICGHICGSCDHLTSCWYCANCGILIGGIVIGGIVIGGIVIGGIVDAVDIGGVGAN